MKTNFYLFEQTNSGGKMHTDEKLCHRLFIEATSANHANTIAEDLGVYFNGCDIGEDCPCCGDRWSEVDSPIDLKNVSRSWAGTEFETIEQYAETLSKMYGYGKANQVDARIFYLSKEIKEIKL